MRTFIYFAFLSILCFTLSNCVATPKAPDQKRPEISISVVEDGSPAKLVVSTNRSQNTVSSQCQSDRNTHNEPVFYTTVVGDTVDVLVTASDASGIKYLRINVGYNQVINERSVNSSSVQPTVQRGPNSVEMFFEYPVEKTAEIVAFSVINASQFSIEASTADHYNVPERLPGNNESTLLIKDDSLCNN